MFLIGYSTMTLLRRTFRDDASWMDNIDEKTLVVLVQIPNDKSETNTRTFVYAQHVIDGDINSKTEVVKFGTGWGYCLIPLTKLEPRDHTVKLISIELEFQLKTEHIGKENYNAISSEETISFCSFSYWFAHDNTSVKHKNPIAMIGWINDSKYQKDTLMGWTNECAITAKSVIKAYRSFLEAVYTTTNISLSLQLHSILLTHLYTSPPCTGISVLNLVRLFSKYSSPSSSTVNNIDRHFPKINELVSSQLSMFVCYGQFVSKFITRENSPSKHELSLTLQQLEENSIPWLLPTAIDQQNDIEINMKKNIKNTPTNNVIHEIEEWYQHCSNELSMESISAIEPTNDDDNDNNGKKKIVTRFNDYLTQALICAANQDVQSDVPNFQSMTIPLIGTVLSMSAHIALASLGTSNALLPSQMMGAQIWRSATGAGGNEIKSDRGAPAAAPSLARSSTLMEREAQWAEVRAMAARGNISQHHTALLKLRASCFALASSYNDPALENQCKSITSELLKLSDDALGPVREFGEWGSDYEVIYRRLQLSGRRLRAANEELVRSFGAGVGQSGYEGKLEYFVGGGGLNKQTMNSGKTVTSLTDGPARASRFLQPRQAVQLQGQEGVVFRLMGGRATVTSSETSRVIENVNRNLAITVKGYSAKRGVRIVLSETFQAADENQSWLFSHRQSAGAGVASGPGEGLLASCSAPQLYIGARAVIPDLDPKNSKKKTNSSMKQTSSLSSLSAAQPIDQDNENEHLFFQDLQLCVSSNNSSNSIEEQTSSLVQESIMAATGGAIPQNEFKLSVPFQLSEDGQLVSGNFAIGLAGEFPLEEEGVNEAILSNEQDVSAVQTCGALVASLSSKGISLDGAELTLVPLGSYKALKFSFANRDPLRGMVLVADYGNHAIRLVNSRDGRVQTLVGGRSSGYEGGALKLLAPKPDNGGPGGRGGGGGGGKGGGKGGDGEVLLPEVGEIIEAMDHRTTRWRRAAVLKISGGEYIRRPLVNDKPGPLIGQFDAFNLTEVLGEKPWTRAMLKLLPDKQCKVVYTVSFLETNSTTMLTDSEVRLRLIEPQVHSPTCLLEMPSGHVLVSDTGNQVVRCIHPDLLRITTTAGAAPSNTIIQPSSKKITSGSKKVDKSDSLLSIGMMKNQSSSSTSLSSKVVSSSSSSSTAYMAPSSKDLTFTRPLGLALVPGSDSQVVCCDSGNQRIILMTLELAPMEKKKNITDEMKEDENSTRGLVLSRWSTFAGQPGKLGHEDSKRKGDKGNTILPAMLTSPSSIVTCPDGAGFFFTDGSALKFLSWPEGAVCTIRHRAKNNSKKDAYATEPNLIEPTGLCFDEEGDLLISDRKASCIFKLTPSHRRSPPRPQATASAEFNKSKTDNQPWPWGCLRWSQGHLTLLVAASKDVSKKNASSAAVASSSNGRDGFIGDMSAPPTCSNISMLSSFDNGAAVIISEENGLRKLHSAKSLDRAAERYQSLREPLALLTNELRMAADVASGAYRALDTAIGEAQRIYEGGVRDLFGLFFRKQALSLVDTTVNYSLCKHSLSPSDAHIIVKASSFSSSHDMHHASFESLTATQPSSSEDARSDVVDVQGSSNDDYYALIFMSGIVVSPSLAQLPYFLNQLRCRKLDSVDTHKNNTAITTTTLFEDGGIGVRRALLSRMIAPWPTGHRSQQEDCFALVQLASYGRTLVTHTFNNETKVEEKLKKDNENDGDNGDVVLVEVDMIIAMLDHSTNNGLSLSPFEGPLALLLNMFYHEISILVTNFNKKEFIQKQNQNSIKNKIKQNKNSEQKLLKLFQLYKTSIAKYSIEWTKTNMKQKQKQEKSSIFVIAKSTSTSMVKSEKDEQLIIWKNELACILLLSLTQDEFDVEDDVMLLSSMFDKQNNDFEEVQYNDITSSSSFSSFSMNAKKSVLLREYEMIMKSAGVNVLRIVLEHHCHLLSNDLDSRMKTFYWLYSPTGQSVIAQCSSSVFVSFKKLLISLAQYFPSYFPQFWELLWDPSQLLHEKKVLLKEKKISNVQMNDKSRILIHEVSFSILKSVMHHIQENENENRNRLSDIEPSSSSSSSPTRLFDQEEIELECLMHGGKEGWIWPAFLTYIAKEQNLLFAKALSSANETSSLALANNKGGDDGSGFKHSLKSKNLNILFVELNDSEEEEEALINDWWQCFCWKKLLKLSTIVSLSFREAAERLSRNEMTVHLIDELNTDASALIGAWRACYNDELPLGVNPQHLLGQAVRDVGRSLAVLQRLSLISHRFFRYKSSQNELLPLTIRAEANWSNLTLQQTSTITDEICEQNPQVLLALAWLHNLSNSASFKVVWDEVLLGTPPTAGKGKKNSSDADDDMYDVVSEDDDDDDDQLVIQNDGERIESRTPQELLFEVVQAWQQVWIKINAKTMGFTELETLAPALLSDGDLELLSSTANAAVKHIEDAAKQVEGCDNDQGGKLPKYIWPTGSIDGSWCYAQRISLRRYECMRKTFQETSLLQRGLAALRLLIRPEAQTEVDDCNTALLTLNAKLAEGWGGYTLADLDKLAVLSESVDSRITNLNPDILECLSSEGCADLFDWLQTIPKDGDFQAAVEMAMGRSELETPPELWVDGYDTIMSEENSGHNTVELKGGPKKNNSQTSSSSEKPTSTGRPDEEKLSMLSSIRSTFHKLLYKHSESRSPLVFDSLKEALHVLSDSVVFSHISPSTSLSANADNSSNVNTARLTRSLMICSGLHLALAELLGDDSDNTAPNRLMLLRQPNWDSHWVVETKHQISFSPTEQFQNRFSKQNNSSLSSQNEVAASNVMSLGNGLPTLASTVRLEYKVPRRGVLLDASQSLAELSDFQGSCVLAKTASGEAQSVAIDVFTQQFRWVQEVGRAVLALKNGGHFDYQGYLKSVPLAASDSVSVLAHLVIEKRSELEAWEQEVRQVRNNGGMINFFDMFQVWQLSRLLENAAQEEQDPNGEKMAWFCHSISPLLARLHPVALDKQSSEGKLLVANFARELLSSWKRFERSGLVSVRDNESSYQLLQSSSSSSSSASPRVTSYVKQSCADQLWAIREALNQAVKVVSNHELSLPRTRLLYSINNQQHDPQQAKMVSSLSSLSSQASTSPASSSMLLKCGVKPNARVAGGLRLLIANDWKHCLAISLSSFFKFGLLPEWYNCLICHKDLPFEILNNFILRASVLSTIQEDEMNIHSNEFDNEFVIDDEEFDTSFPSNDVDIEFDIDPDSSFSSSTNQQGGHVFVLVGVHLLSLDDQHLALEMIRSSPLVNNADGLNEAEIAENKDVVMIDTNQNYSKSSHQKNESSNNAEATKKKKTKKKKTIQKCLNSLILVAVVDASESSGSIGPSRSASPLVTQFGSYRSVEEPLSDRDLCSLFQQFGPSSKQHSQGIQLLSSLLPGAGKSFQAKIIAHEKQSEYVHVRVNKSLAPSQLADLIENRIQTQINSKLKLLNDQNRTVSNMKSKEEDDDVDDDDDFVEINDEDEVVEEMLESKLNLTVSNKQDDKDEEAYEHFMNSQPILIHLDLAESVDDVFDIALFDLLTLGCLISSNQGTASGGGLWWWNPKNISFVVELSSHSLYKRLSSLSWMENMSLTSSPQQFIADAIRLEIGQGSEVFYSRRCDGTTSLVSDQVDGKQPKMPKHVIIKGLKVQYHLNGKNAQVKAFDDNAGKFVVEIQSVSVTTKITKLITARIAAKYLKPRALTLEEEEDEKSTDKGGGGVRIGKKVWKEDVSPDPNALAVWEAWHRGVAENNEDNLSDDGNTTNAYVRLQYVCGCLDMMSLLGGYLPLDVEVPISNLMKKGGLSGERCFHLISRAMNSGGGALNYWSLWAFVNGLFIQFKGLNDQRLVLSSALSRDPKEDGVTDNASKQLLKAALVSFACSSTLEMMTRQRRLADPQRLACLRVQHHSYGSVNGLWVRQPFDHAGRSVFSASGKFIYFRPARPNQQTQNVATDSAEDNGLKRVHQFSSNCWVLDSSIRSVGLPMSISLSQDICGQWVSIPKNQEERNESLFKHNVSVAFSVAENGHDYGITIGHSSESKDVMSFPKNGDLQLNGRYEFSGQNVNGCPHFVKSVSLNNQEDGDATMSSDVPLSAKSNQNQHKKFKQTFGHRRHLFYSTNERTWVIAARCDETEGILAMNVSGTSIGSASTMMPLYCGSEWVLYSDGGTSSTPTDGGKMLQINESALVITPLSAERAEEEYGIGVISENKLKEEVFDDREYLSDLLPWSSSNHNSVLVSASGSERGGLRMLCLKGNKLSSTLHPHVKAFVDVHGVPFGADPKSSYGGPSVNQAAVLTRLFGEITDRHLSPPVALKLMGGRFVLTADTLLKVRAIVARLRCGVPVILMGECGCGKTALLNYLCAWLGIDLEVLDVHGGTSERDLEEAFVRAEQKASKGQQNFLFLDEMNACLHTGLVEEAITKHTLHGRPLNDNLRILAAANPYRKRNKTVFNTSAHSGFVYEGGAKTMEKDLVYNVHPIPASLHEFIFDFGALSAVNEAAYAIAMVKSILVKANTLETRAAAAMISAAQKHVRECEGDPSAVSLRDVARCLKLVRFFYKAGGNNNNNNSGGRTVVSLSIPLTLAIAHVYYFRLGSMVDRRRLWVELRNALIGVRASDASRLPQDFLYLLDDGKFDEIVSNAKRRFCNRFDLEPGVALNQALMENLYVVVVCILNKLPVFVVGKPGSSKTLAMAVIVSNLQGEQSSRPFWRKFPAVTLFSFQCSPMTQADGILQQFNMACNYAKHATNTRTVLLLDEVGLAEHSPDMPLKVLHGILVDPPISVVGISNWALDAAKMNRAICLMRPEPKEGDLLSTGESIVHAAPPEQPKPSPQTTSAAEADTPPPPPPPTLARSTSIPTADLSSVLGPLASAYHAVYSGQQRIAGGRDFIGMRDYYAMLKMLRGSILKTARASQCGNVAKLDSLALDNAIFRNFGGKPLLLLATVKIFRKKCFSNKGNYKAITGKGNKIKEYEDDGDDVVNNILNAKDKLFKFRKPPTLDLINENLNDSSARHLMVLTRQGAALPLLLNANAITLSESVVLVGSGFEEDRAELRLVQQINQVKRAMASGKVVVLVNHDQIYEALYDVLNQRFISRTSPTTGKTVKMLRLAIGARSQLCPVTDGFRVIVIAEQEHAYKDLDLPLLNRFEKQLLLASDLLTPTQQMVLRELEDWVVNVANECANMMGKPQMQILKKTVVNSEDHATLSGEEVTGIRSVIEVNTDGKTKLAGCEMFLSSVFPGFDESTLHTLILGLPDVIDDRNMTSDDRVDEEKKDEEVNNVKIAQEDKTEEENKNRIAQERKKMLKLKISTIVSQAQELLALVASPVAHTYSQRLSVAWKRSQLTRLEKERMNLIHESEDMVEIKNSSVVKELEDSNVQTKSFFELHGDLKSVFDSYLSKQSLPLTPKNENNVYTEEEANQIAQASAQLLNIATFSSLPELSSSLLIESCPNFKTKSIRLASISSEWQLLQILSSFYNSDQEDNSFELPSLGSGDSSPQDQQTNHETQNKRRDNGVDVDHSLLVIQIDPVSSSPGMMVHARYLVEQSRSEYVRSYSQQLQSRNNQLISKSANEMTTNPLRHVCLVVHVPPAVRMKSRNWCLDMHYSDTFAAWQYLFLDDITPEVRQNKNSSSGSMDTMFIDTTNSLQHDDSIPIELDTSSLLPSTQVMVTSSLADLGSYALRSGAVSSLLLTSLSRCGGPPPPSTVSLDFHHRLSCIKKRFGFDIPTTNEIKPLNDRNIAKDKNIELLIRETFLDILRASDVSDISSSSSSSSIASKGALHVQLATGIGSSGSLRQSLYLSVEHILSQALATLMAHFDRDFNLSLSAQAATDVMLSDVGFSTFFNEERPEQQSSQSHMIPKWYEWLNDAKVLIHGMEVIREQVWCEMVLLAFDTSLLIRKAGRLDGAANSVIENSGAYGSLAASFPFSYKVWSVLDSEGASDLLLRCRRRDIISVNDKVSMDNKRGQEVKDRATQLSSLAISVFGESCVTQWRKFGEFDHGMCFLRDWILSEGGAYPPGHGLNIQLLIRIHAVAINAHLNSAVSYAEQHCVGEEEDWCFPITPISILSSLTILCKQHIFYLASILSCPLFPPSIISKCLSAAEVVTSDKPASASALWSLYAITAITNGFIETFTKLSNKLSVQKSSQKKIKTQVHNLSTVIISISSDMMSYLLSLENEFGYGENDKEELIRTEKVISVALNWRWLHFAASLLVDITAQSQDSMTQIATVIKLCVLPSSVDISSVNKPKLTCTVTFELVSNLLMMNNKQGDPPPYAATLFRFVLNKNASKQRNLNKENKGLFSVFSSSSTTSAPSTSIPELIPDMELVAALACLANGERAVTNSHSKKCQHMCLPFVHNISIRYLCLQSLVQMGEEGKNALNESLDIGGGGALQIYVNNLEDGVKFDDQKERFETAEDDTKQDRNNDELLITMLLSATSSSSSKHTLEFGESVFACRRVLKKFAATVLVQCNKAESHAYDKIDRAQRQLESTESKLIELKKVQHTQNAAMRNNRNMKKQQDETTRKIKNAQQALSAAQLAVSALPTENVSGNIMISENLIISKLKVFEVLPLLLELKGPAIFLLKMILSQTGYDGLSKVFIYCRQHVWLQQALVSVGVMPSGSKHPSSSSIRISEMSQWLTAYMRGEAASGPSSLDGTSFALSSSSSSVPTAGDDDDEDDSNVRLYEHFRGRLSQVLSDTFETGNHKAIISFSDDLKKEIKLNLDSSLSVAGTIKNENKSQEVEGVDDEENNDQSSPSALDKQKAFNSWLLALVSTTFDVCFSITATKKDTMGDAHFLKIGYHQLTGIDQINSIGQPFRISSAAADNDSDDDGNGNDETESIHQAHRINARKLALKFHHTISGYFSRQDPVVNIMYRFTSQQSISLGQIAMAISNSSSPSSNSSSSKVPKDVFAGGEMAKFPTSVRRLCLHTGLVACRHLNSWLSKAIHGRLEFLKQFVPTIPDEDPNRIFKALEKTEGRLRWYSCPRGHPYSVGECGMPMQEGRCTAPGCGAIIGGQSHVVAKGCKTISMNSIKVQDGPGTKGYQTTELGHYEVDRKKLGYSLSPLAVACMRILLHLTIIIGTEQSIHNHSSSSTTTSIGKQGSKSEMVSTPELSSTCTYLVQDLNTVARLLELTNVSDVVMVVHILLQKFDHLLNKTSLFPNQLSSKDTRSTFERRFVTMVVDPLFPMGSLSNESKHLLAKGKEVCGDAAFTARLLNFLNPDVWDLLSETSTSTLISSPVPNEVMNGGWMWRMRKTTTISGLRAWLSANSSRTKDFPFLTAFLNEEEDIDEDTVEEGQKKRTRSVLELVSCAADILEWHGVLFEAIGDRSFTRADAMSFTNSDVIAWLPESKQANAWSILDKYCIAFNNTLPLVEALYECQRNPFLNSKNEVNLTGGAAEENDDGNGMSVDTPIAFSLPSAPPGEVDASGLCTLMILRRLERAHNALVDRFAQARTNAINPHSTKTISENQSFVLKPDNEDEEEEVIVAPSAPAISYLTLPSLARKALLAYDRNQLRPILARCSNQPLGDENGNNSFDFNGQLLEDELAKMLRLDGSEVGPVLITVRQFEYAGENLRAIGTLAAIDNRCPQVPLPLALSNALHREVDTANSLTRLLRILETCAHVIGGGFGGTGGKSGINPQTKLTTFVCGTLLHHEKDWLVICPKAIASHATLSHLRDLLLTVEAKELGRLPTHAVALKFREPLEPMDLQELKAGLSYIPTSSSTSSKNGYSLDSVLGPFRDLLEGPLADPSDFSPNESLRNFLCYQDIDLEDEGTWFSEHFPYNLKLAHALETYLILAASASEQPEF